ncbi:MAG: DnaD domain protein [Lachnospiraceae bacterium]|nr:DnaD domain protein [Lachnospiraceae bacterium]
MLGKVRITSEQDNGYTRVANTFIDDYMTEANDAQLKIYLYLLRVLQAGTATTVAEIADRFNHTERDVKRALQFWEKKGLVRLEYDAHKRLAQICLEDISGGPCASVVPEEAAPGYPEEDSAYAVPQKRQYTPLELRRFAADESLSMILFAAEKYFKHVLNNNEMQTNLYIYEDLSFPADLLDYLLQYTAENARGRFASYMEKTALAWHAEGLLTLDAVRNRRTTRFDAGVYEVMRALGLTTAPTDFEAEYVERWRRDYGFSMEVILLACRRTVAGTQSHRMEYTDGILRNWRDKQIRTAEDVERETAAHEKTRRGARQSLRRDEPQAAAVDTRNRFNRFQAQEYDFQAIKEKLVSNNQ